MSSSFFLSYARITLSIIVALYHRIDHYPCSLSLWPFLLDIQLISLEIITHLFVSHRICFMIDGFSISCFCTNFSNKHNNKFARQKYRCGCTVLFTMRQNIFRILNSPLITTVFRQQLSIAIFLLAFDDTLATFYS